MNRKYMILCVAGQSNAVGYDESPMTQRDREWLDHPRIRQLGLYGENNLRAIPLGVCAENYQDMRPYGHPENQGAGTKGIHLPLAHLLLEQIPKDYSLLVISCAYGGTGFTCGTDAPYDKKAMRPETGVWRWSTLSGYYLGMRDRIAYALDQNPENRFLGVVWCQGEQDAADAAGHIAGFDAMTKDFFAYFASKYPGRVYRGAWDRGIWYNHETTYHWYTCGQCPQIWEAYRRFSPETYVEIPRETDTNEVNGTGITARIRAAHFGNDAYARIVAPRVAAVMKRRLTDA